MSLKPVQALNLDSVQQQAFVKFFNELPKKPPTTVRIFDRNDYYSVHGADDAFTAAKEVFNSTSHIKKMGVDPNKLDYLVLSKSNFEKLIKKLLLVKRYRVEIYVAEGSIKSNDWSLKYKGSPGYFSQLDEILGDGVTVSEGSTPCLMAVNIRMDAVSKCRLVGIACIAAVDYQISVAEFTDDDLLTELESIIVQMAPSECLVPQSDNDDYKALHKAMERDQVTMTKLKKADFSTDGLIQDLNRLLKFKNDQDPNAYVFPETSKQLAMTSLAGAIKYTGLINESTNFGRFRLTTIQANNFLHFDAAALSSLNVLPELDDTSKHRARSLFGLLDRCRTQQGKRLLAQWLRQPLRDINLINERLDIVQLLVRKSQLRLQLYEDHLRRVPDLHALVRRLTRKKANLQDCYKIYQGVARLPVLLRCLAEADNPVVHSAFAEPMSELNEDLDKFKQMIEATVDMDAVDKGDFLVKPSFDNKLQNLHEDLQDLQKKAERLLKDAADELNKEAGKTIKLETNPQSGFNFRVTTKAEKSLRDNKKYVIITTLKGCVKFKTSMLESYSEEYVDIKAKYEKEQGIIVNEIIGIAASYSECLFCLSHILARLDVLVAFAMAAATAPYPYCRPVITESIDEFKLVDVRHPCLEVQEGVSYIPNDVEFKRGEKIMHIVTGANMGGKSTWMRSCGLAVLMAHAGCLVAAKEAKVPRLRAVRARVGAADREDRGQSTFMLEMVESAAMVRSATADSLILVDELGRGTSTYEGCGIAWAIAEELALKSQSFCLFATHYHELTRLAGLHPGLIVNSHAEACVVKDKLLLLHKIKPGPALQSLGLYVAKLADLPDDVIEYAEKKQSELETNMYEIETSMSLEKLTEGQKIISEFLKECKRIHETAPSDDIMEKEINELKEQIRKQNNKYVLSLI